MLAVSTGAIALPAVYCGRVLDAWEAATLEGACHRPLSPPS